MTMTRPDKVQRATRALARMHHELVSTTDPCWLPETNISVEALTLARSVPGRAPTTLRAWLATRNHVETLQCDVIDDTVDCDPWARPIRNIWSPGARSVEMHSTYAMLGGSVRNFVGVTCIAADDRLFVGFTTGWQVIIYSTVD